MLNRILLVGLLAGVLAGLATTGLQMLWTVPLIQEAEGYEVAEAPADHAHDGAGHAHGAADHHHHGGEAWMPEDGLERTFWTAVTNVLLGFGGGLLMAGAFALRRGRVSLSVGLGWGFAAFLAVSAAPAIGLPPELPGMAAAALEDRQVWWLATAGLTAAGLGSIAYGPALAWRLGGVALILLPHLIGAPQPASHETAVPVALSTEFVVASLATTAVFWIALGALTGVLARRFDLTAPQPASAQGA